MEAGAQPAVVFQNVTKIYNKSFRALDGLSFSIKRGELYGLIGPNGAGKTTSIRVLTGLVTADSGQVEVLGHRPDDPAVRPLIGYMPQETALYLDLTVRGERVGLVNHGQLIAEDAPAELMHQTHTKSLEDAFLALAGRQRAVQ
jgi:ABC-type Mn2+/Zn2+ transport system ATPase subunit